MSLKLKKIFISLLLLLLSISCGDKNKLKSKEKPENVLVISTISDPKSFNIIVAKETSTTAVLRFLFEGLTRTDGVTTEVKPHLAERWEISKDGLVWTFYLRKDVQWFDGVPFTADDVVFTFNDLIYNESIPTSARDIFTIAGKKIKVEKVDTYTVRFILPKPFAPLLRSLEQEILPKHVLSESVKAGKFNFTWGLDTKPTELIGTGPFMLVEYVPGQRLVYKKNPNYWMRDSTGRRLPYIDKIVMLIVPDQDTQLAKFTAGEIDAISVRGEDYAVLKAKEKEGNFTIYNCGPNFGSEFICFNLNPGKKAGKPYVNEKKLKWFSNVLFRRAIAHAIDKQSIIKNVYYGLAYPQDAAESEANVFFHNPSVKKYSYDLEKAKNILKEAGFIDRNNDGILEDSEGNPVEFDLLTNSNNIQRVKIANIIISDLRKIGIKVNLQAIDFNLLVSKLDSTYDWEAVLIGLTGGIEPHHGRNVWHSSGQLHLWHPVQKKPATDWEKELDEIFDKAATTIDPEERRKLYFRYQEIVSEQLPVIFTVNQAALYAVRNKFGNLKPTAYGGIFHNIEEIYILGTQNN